MPRAEPCPVPGCIDFKAHGSIMCRRHWRMLCPALRQHINGLWRALQRTKRNGDDRAFRGWARSFIETRAASVTWVLEQEGIDVLPR